MRIVDKYNTDKVWIVRFYKKGQVYINQEIKGLLFYKSFQRTNKRYLKEIGLI